MSSDITALALIAKIKKQTESFDTVVLQEGEANALVEALEKAQHKSAVDWEAAASLNVENQELKKNVTEMEEENNRQVLEVMRLSSLVAEMESRTVTVKLPEIERPIDGTGYATAAGERRYKERVIDALRAAGIQIIEGEEQ
ncbi:hypothetical protein PZ59_06670 [Salmonella enterica subsp. enterica serovar Brandenburg]|uniref:hypothetical protein n=1 Tax=Salmonella enterica TaxID=28901 RepID=UPI00127028AF|nr:hypothetical protein [Salmonella enterica subsp. enterica]ECB4090238.1 hypothetical protein [Salmonella enterica subsp. enterica serovar Muenster]ECF2355334.1 hypothetical protein [Salmonella enterica subsp. enterica serovar Brandenburg]EDB3343873.1 hypothetical protein [Salmonella enterica subsp. enterica serovar Give]EJT0872351.1 hypothetical protein [Salmonella enterica]